MIRKIIEATFPSAASITFHISSGRDQSVKFGARNTGRSVVRRRCTGGIRASYYNVPEE
jgi:hypothetical protein